MVVFNRTIQLLGRNSLYLRKSLLNDDLADIDSESDRYRYQKNSTEAELSISIKIGFRRYIQI